MKNYGLLSCLLFASLHFSVNAEESVRENVPTVNDTSRNRTGSGLTFTPKPQLDHTSYTTLKLIKSFEVFVPISVDLCPTNNPWLLGKRVLKNNDVLSSKYCFSLRLVANDNVDYYFFSQSTNGKSFKLFPNTCDALGKVTHHLAANETINLPKFNEPHVGAIGLDSEKGTEWLHAVVTRSPAAKKELEELVREIPDVCEPPVNVNYSADLLQRVFKSVRKNYPNDFDWKSVKFIHQ